MQVQYTVALESGMAGMAAASHTNLKFDMAAP